MSEFNSKQIEIIKNHLYPMISKLEDSKSEYYNVNNILDELIDIINKNSEGPMWRCLECGVDMGRCNPRQLCGKTYCYNKL